MIQPLFYRTILLICLTFCSFVCQAQGIILIVGDSLSAGFNIPNNKDWPSLLQQKLTAEGADYLIENASVTGATTADGLRLLPQLLSDYSPSVVIIALGSNDGMRGQPILNIKINLGKMIEMSQNSNSAQVLLIGFKLPLNYGEPYRTQFEQIYTDLSKKYDVQLVPFLLDGFAQDLKYFQSDRLHPTVAAQPKILDNVWKVLMPMLDD